MAPGGEPKKMWRGISKTRHGRVAQVLSTAKPSLAISAHDHEILLVVVRSCIVGLSADFARIIPDLVPRAASLDRGLPFFGAQLQAPSSVPCLRSLDGQEGVGRGATVRNSEYFRGLYSVLDALHRRWDKRKTLLTVRVQVRVKIPVRNKWNDGNMTIIKNKSTNDNDASGLRVYMCN